MNEKYIVVGGLPRTGGSLIPFFLDGQKELYTLPYEQHISNQIGVLPNDDLFSGMKSEDVLKRILRSSLREGRVAKNSIDKSKQEYDFDYENYVKDINLFIKNSSSTKNYLYEISKIWLQYRGVYKEDKFILNHTSRSFFYNTEKLFSELNIGAYIYTKRKFIDWFSSITKSTNLQSLFNDLNFINYSYNVWSISNRLAEYYEKRFSDKFMTLDYDDLLVHPKENYKRLCDFLNLEYDENFNYAPSYLGISTVANSSFKEKKVEAGKLIKPKDNSKYFDQETLVYIKKLEQEDVTLDINENTINLYHQILGSYFQYWGMLRSNGIKTISTRNLFFELKSRFFKKYF